MSRSSHRSHAALAAAPLAGDALTLGGEPVTRIAERVGHTPFYAYDRAAIDARVKQLRATLPSGLSLHYAVKANPMPAVVGHLAGLADGLDVASAGELHVALDAGAAPGDISFAGPRASATRSCAPPSPQALPSTRSRRASSSGSRAPAMRSASGRRSHCG